MWILGLKGLKHEKEGVNNSKIQKKAKVEEHEEDWNGPTAIVVFENLLA